MLKLLRVELSRSCPSVHLCTHISAWCTTLSFTLSIFIVKTTDALLWWSLIPFHSLSFPFIPSHSLLFPLIPFPYISRQPSAAQNIKGARVQVQQSQVAEGRGTHASRGKFWEAQRLYGTLWDGSHAISSARRVSNWGNQSKDVQTILDNLWCSVLTSLEILDESRR